MKERPKFSRTGVAFFLLLALAAGVLTASAPPAVEVGIEVLAAENFRLLAGKRVGLITNHTGRTRSGEATIEVLARAPGVELAALFAPEHGLAGKIEEDLIPSGQHAGTGLPVHSLYGATRRPTAAMLAGLDVLVFDLQDAGVRFFTYLTTLGYLLEEAARHRVAVVVLDRPNPLGGVAVEGPLLDADQLSFEGYFPLPLRHGMTLGELALLFNAEKHLGTELTVVPMRGWRRSQWFDQTGWSWVAPSPNLGSLAAATLYPAVELLRAGGVSVGRGTPTPFELIGAPWVRCRELREYLEKRGIAGAGFTCATFRPTADVHAGQLCHGLHLQLEKREELDVGRLGAELLAALHRFYPNQFQLEKTIRLLGSRRTLARIRAGDDPADIVAGWQAELDAFRQLRRRYLLYD